MSTDHAVTLAISVSAISQAVTQDSTPFLKDGTEKEGTLSHKGKAKATIVDHFVEKTDETGKADVSTLTSEVAHPLPFRIAKVVVAQILPTR